MWEKLKTWWNSWEVGLAGTPTFDWCEIEAGRVFNDLVMNTRMAQNFYAFMDFHNGYTDLIDQGFSCTYITPGQKPPKGTFDRKIYDDIKTGLRFGHELRAIIDGKRDRIEFDAGS